MAPKKVSGETKAAPKKVTVKKVAAKTEDKA